MKVLLYSGGTDSWLIKELWEPDICLYVDMESMYSKQELEKVSHHRPETFCISKLPLGMFEDKETAFIPMRNMYLLMQACHYGDTICLGATKEDEGGSSDKDIDFLTEAEHLLNRLWKKQSLFDGKQITVEKTFIQYTKGELIQQYLEKGGDINRFKDETFSCYSPKGSSECLNCKACFRKFVACYNNGADYTQRQLRRIYRFAEKNVVHRNSHAKGRYFLEKNNAQEVLAALTKLYKELGKELILD
jgi:7-cyano-7-deazaguanine synthase in queuosine biosynthesis